VWFWVNFVRCSFNLNTQHFQRKKKKEKYKWLLSIRHLNLLLDLTSHGNRSTQHISLAHKGKKKKGLIQEVINFYKSWLFVV
jgi:hypothetical protein